MKTLGKITSSQHQPHFVLNDVLYPTARIILWVVWIQPYPKLTGWRWCPDGTGWHSSAAGASGKAALSCVDSWKAAMKISRCFLLLMATWLRSSKLHVCEEILPSSPVAMPPTLVQHTFKCPGFPVFLGGAAICGVAVSSHGCST